MVEKEKTDCIQTGRTEMQMKELKSALAKERTHARASKCSSRAMPDTINTLLDVYNKLKV